MKKFVPIFCFVWALCGSCRSEVSSPPAGTVQLTEEDLRGNPVEVIYILKEKPLCLLLEGKPDLRNVHSRIWKEGKDSLITLPTNAGLIGVSEEEGLLIMQSYEYYRQGGRYNRIEAYDMDGRLLGTMSPKLTPEWDKEIDL